MPVPEHARGTGEYKVITQCNEICKAVVELLNKESLFPKKTRWMFAGKIADLMNDFHTAVCTANEIRPKTAAEAADRHRMNTLALARLKALDSKLNLARDIYGVNPGEFRKFAALVNEEYKILNGVIASDEKRFAEMPQIK